MNVTAQLLSCDCCQLYILSLSLSLMSSQKRFEVCHDDTLHRTALHQPAHSSSQQSANSSSQQSANSSSQQTAAVSKHWTVLLWWHS